MKILAMDSATSACSAAVWCDGAIQAHRFQAMERGQSEALIPMVIETVAQAGLEFADLDLIAVTTGPGAFTGVRIGLASARGLALAGDLPMVGVTTLEAVARGVPADERQDRRLVVVIDAKRRDFYGQCFGSGLEALGPPAAVMPQDAQELLSPGPVLVAGDGAEQLRAALAGRRNGAREGDLAREGDFDGDHIRYSQAPGRPDAVQVAAIAAERGPEGARAPVRPLYLRPPDATLPSDGGRLRP